MRRKWPLPQALLIIEVAESSLATDRNVKAAIYAASGVPEYWIMNLVDHVIEVSTDPSGDAYAKTTIYRRGAQITLTQFPDVTIRVADVLPT
jgi:Uma2 family endonuclease